MVYLIKRKKETGLLKLELKIQETRIKLLKFFVNWLASTLNPNI